MTALLPGMVVPNQAFGIREADNPVQEQQDKIGEDQQIYKVKGPDGNIIKVKGPKNAPEKLVIQKAQQLSREKDKFENRELSDIPGEALRNAPKSGADAISGIWQFITNPIDSLSALRDAGEGNFYNHHPYLKDIQIKKWNKEADKWAEKAVIYQQQGNKKAFENAIKKSEEYSTRMERITGQASAFGQYVRNRYGGWQEFKRTMAEDPFGFALDATAVLSGGATVAPRLSRIANAIDPIAGVTKLTKKLGRGTASLVDASTARVGKDAFMGALKAGADDMTALLTRKPSQSAGFVQQMRGAPGYNGERLVGMAQDAVSNFRQARNAQYTKTMAGAETMDLTNAFKDLSEQLAKTKDKFAMHKGQVVDKDMANFLADIEKEILYFRNKPELHDLVGMDKLKQNIQNKIEQLPLTATAKKTAGGEIASSIRNTLKKNNPQYAKAMDEYAEATKFIKDDLGSLSLAGRGKTDTILRKLTSITRDGVNTNFGARKQAVTKLADFGAEGNLIPEIIGNAFSGIAPRGIGQGIAGVGAGGSVAIGGVASIPTALAFMMSQSPRVVGEILYKLGQAGGVPAKLLNALATNPKFTQVVAPYINMQQTAIGQ